jgi:hypothetical protein
MDTSRMPGPLPGRSSRLAPSSRSARAFALAALVFGLGLGTPEEAHAVDPAAADALFQAAKKLMAAKQYDEACAKFDASYEIDPTLGTLLNLADCYEKLGRVATAWSKWGEAMEKALRDDDKRADYAKQRRDALTPSLPKVTIHVSKEVPGIDILWDGKKLSPAVYGVDLPVDPIEHDLVVLRDDGVRLDEQRVPVTAEKTKKEISLDLEALDRAKPRKVEKKDPSPPLLPPPAKNTQRIAGLVVGGFGAAALVTSGVLEGIALAKKGSADAPDSCVNKFCTPGGLAQVQSARTFAAAGQWIGIGGLVAFAVGTTLFVTAPPAPSPARASRPDPLRPSLWASPYVGPTGSGLVVGGTL